MKLVDVLKIYNIDKKDCIFIRFGLYTSIKNTIKRLGTKEYCSRYLNIESNIGKTLLFFVGINNQYSLLYGIYRIKGYIPVENMTGEFGDNQKGYHVLEEVESCHELIERLEIKYNSRWRIKNFDVVEVSGLYPERGLRKLETFHSYEDVYLNFLDLKEIIEKDYQDYIVPLSGINAIYMIVDTFSGKQYIGSSYGRGGLLGRWKCYIDSNGTGGDVELTKIIFEDPSRSKYFNYMILKTLPLKITADEAIEYENKYKERYFTRTFGLNKN